MGKPPTPRWPCEATLKLTRQSSRSHRWRESGATVRALGPTMGEAREGWANSSPWGQLQKDMIKSRCC
jgi:hypothetical protein